MSIAVSNIAWTKNEEDMVASLLNSTGVRYIEVAPTKEWQDPTKATDGEISTYKTFWDNKGLEIVAFQSMLFPRPDLKLFESEENRQKTKEYLNDFIVLAGKLGAKVLVFGSPKNRQLGEVSYEDAFSIAVDFFRELGQTAIDNNTCFCIEPNPVDYACDFVVNTQQGVDLVKAVDHPGFGLHLDIAGMTLAGDDIARSIVDAAPLLRHFHASAPFLGHVNKQSGVDHETAARALKDIDYKGIVSIEMRPTEEGTNANTVETAVHYIQDIYTTSS